MKKVMIVDGGGRAAALAAKYSESKKVSSVLVTPGNDLISLNKKCKIFPRIKTTDVTAILKIASREKVDLVDVAQDAAIAAGVVDSLLAKGFRVLGPTKAAGQIEWDKAWARNFMKANNLPIPDFYIAKNEKEGINFVKSQKNSKWYVKVSGLAAGKGALFARSTKEAIEKAKEIKSFGAAAKTFLIEECLDGEEFSAFAIASGEEFKVLGYAQDHKTVYDKDEGPNTGGMGCTSMPTVIDQNIKRQTEAIFKKTLQGLVKIKRPYVGILYLGGMIVNSKVKIIEFNARWGDPEAQVIIPSIKNDFFDLAMATIEKKIKSISIKKDNLYRVVVAGTSRGYPNDYSSAKGKEISGLSKIIDGKVKILGAGVQIKNKKFIASGGRLFYILSEGKDVAKARRKAYDALSQIYIEGNNLHYRTDIGYRDLERFYKDK